MALREHDPIVIDQFNGLWDRGDVEETPLDHFSSVVNCRSIGNSGFGTRDGISPSQNVAAPLKNILRIYNYPMTTGNTQLVLTQGGNLYHVVNSTTVFGPILTIASMTDFGFVSYNGRAYISPSLTTLVSGMNRETGISGEFLYVYKGDGTNARKAAGNPPPLTPAVNVANGAAGHTDEGNKLFGVVYETDTGYLTSPGALSIFLTNPVLSLNITAIPTSPDAFVIKRHLVASRSINDYNGDVTGYDLFFIPGGTINDNVTTVLNGVSFYDADLVDDASHLFDNFSQISAGVNLSIYHNRLCLVGESANISLVRASAVSEPEAISQVDGFCIVPPNGDPLTNITDLRDVLYVFKRNKTIAFVDNGQEPSSWPITTVDPAIGCGIHGVGTVTDSNASNVDFLLIGSYQGITLFNGKYIVPELSWKMGITWQSQDFKTNNRRIQICNDAPNQKLYIVLTDRSVLFADYSNGLDPKKIKWWPWTFNGKVNCIAITNVDEILFGMDQI